VKFKKIAPIAVGIALIAGLTTGCSAGTTSSDSGQKVTVNWWTWDPNQMAAYQSCLPAFEKANPNITVKMSQYNVSDYFTKLTAGFVAGNAPDAFMNSVTYLQSYASQNQLLPLDKYIKQDKLDVNSTYSIGASAWKYTDGKQYALPMDWATETLYYSKDALEKAGYTADDVSKLSWNPTDGGTFEKMVAHLTIDKNGVRGDEPGFDPKNVKTYGIGNLEGTGDPFGQNTWGVLLATDNINIPNKQNWATELRYGNPKVIQGLQNIKSLSTKGYAPAFNQFTSADTDQLASGQVAMTLGGTWEATTFAKLPSFKAGVAPVPTGSDGKRHLWSNSNGNVISASTKHPDQTWKWISYQESAACQTKAAQVNGSFLPSIASSMTALAKNQESQGVDYSVFTNYVNNKELIPSPVYNNGAAIQNAVVPQFEAYFTGKSDESIFPKLQAQAKTLLAAK
jgi:ABC-type glycerol-3-phosphate transport system substrate-binding protein